jgi:hypothetical protein
VTPLPAGATPPAMPPGTTPPGATPPAGVAPTTPPEAAPPAGVPPATTPPAQPGTTPAQVIVTPPGTEFRVSGGPYTVPVTINNASRLSTLTVTITYNPAILRVRTATEGTFMRQGGLTASFTPRIDQANGRVDITFTRANDQTGASGSGLLAALQVEAVAPGSSTIGVTGVALGPTGTPLSIASSPVTVTVR